MAELVGGYRIDLEDKAGLLASATDARRLLKVGDTPERVDPRNSPLAKDGFMRVEDQGQQGSCQGNALSTAAEYPYAVATGKVIQLSRQYAYIGSQLEDNINGDSGSTLSGGTKLALKGLCREAVGPYASRYPGRSYITKEMVDDAKNYRLQSHTEIKSSDHGREFIGSGAGIIQIGIAWDNSMTPDSNGCIREFRVRGGGGHSVVFGGYVPDSDVGQSSGSGWRFCLANSWGAKWGPLNGWAYVSPKAFDQMLRHQFTVMLGRSDMATPDIRDLPYDFTRPGKGIRV